MVKLLPLKNVNFNDKVTSYILEQEDDSRRFVWAALLIPEVVAALADALARTKNDAYELCKPFGGADRPVEITAGGTKPSYLYHYHPKIKPKLHVWYWYDK